MNRLWEEFLNDTYCTTDSSGLRPCTRGRKCKRCQSESAEKKFKIYIKGKINPCSYSRGNTMSMDTIKDKITN